MGVGSGGMKSSTVGAGETVWRVVVENKDGGDGIDGDGTGLDVAWEEDVLANEKKSTAGVPEILEADRRGGALRSSIEMLDRPLFNEGGKKDTEGVSELVSSKSRFVVRLTGTASVVASSVSSSTTPINVDVVDCLGLGALNTSPGPFLPPSIRSG